MQPSSVNLSGLHHITNLLDVTELKNKVYNIVLHRYRDQKIIVCGKDLNPLLLFFIPELMKMRKSRLGAHEV